MCSRAGGKAPTPSAEEENTAMKRIALLGSTGSIGENTLRVIRKLAPEFVLTGLSAHRDGRRLLTQAGRWGVTHVALSDPEEGEKWARRAPHGIHIFSGPDSLDRLVVAAEPDLIVCAVVGLAGLRPVLTALRLGCEVALATKEVLVAGGHLVQQACRRYGGRIVPIDSEPSAIFQCLAGAPRLRGERPWALVEDPRSLGIRRLILTSSGGPFGLAKKISLQNVTVAQSLAHPRWKMGRKVTVDSATLMNKGLEMMEVHWLFGVSIRDIEILIHPESIVHSLVEFLDGSCLAQLSLPDMRFAIQYALTYPARRDSGLPPLDLTRVGRLHFFPPNERRFPCLRLARKAGLAGGTLPAVLNGANDVAVEAFTHGRIRFTDIWKVVDTVMEKHKRLGNPDLDAVLEADRFARNLAATLCGLTPSARGAASPMRPTP